MQIYYHKVLYFKSEVSPGGYRRGGSRAGFRSGAWRGGVGSLSHYIFSVLEAVGVLWLLVPFPQLQSQREDSSGHFSIVTFPCMVTYSQDPRIGL